MSIAYLAPSLVLSINLHLDRNEQDEEVIEVLLGAKSRRESPKPSRTQREASKKLRNLPARSGKPPRSSWR